MIKEMKSMAQTLINAITPKSMIDHPAITVNVNAQYDWKSQTTVGDKCQFGTSGSTSQSSGNGFQDSDSWLD